MGADKTGMAFAALASVFVIISLPNFLAAATLHLVYQLLGFALVAAVILAPLVFILVMSEVADAIVSEEDEDEPPSPLEQVEIAQCDVNITPGPIVTKIEDDAVDDEHEPTSPLEQAESVKYDVDVKATPTPSVSRTDGQAVDDEDESASPLVPAKSVKCDADVKASPEPEPSTEAQTADDEYEPTSPLQQMGDQFGVDEKATPEPKPTNTEGPPENDEGEATSPLEHVGVGEGGMDVKPDPGPNATNTQSQVDHDSPATQTKVLITAADAWYSVASGPAAIPPHSDMAYPSDRRVPAATMPAIATHAAKPKGPRRRSNIKGSPAIPHRAVIKPQPSNLSTQPDRFNEPYPLNTIPEEYVPATPVSNESTPYQWMGIFRMASHWQHGGYYDPDVKIKNPRPLRYSEVQGQVQWAHAFLDQHDGSDSDSDSDADSDSGVTSVSEMSNSGSSDFVYRLLSDTGTQHAGVDSGAPSVSSVSWVPDAGSGDWVYRPLSDISTPDTGVSSDLGASSDSGPSSGSWVSNIGSSDSAYRLLSDSGQKIEGVSESKSNTASEYTNVVEAQPALDPRDFGYTVDGVPLGGWAPADPLELSKPPVVPQITSYASAEPSGSTACSTSGSCQTSHSEIPESASGTQCKEVVETTAVLDPRDFGYTADGVPLGGWAPADPLEVSRPPAGSQQTSSTQGNSMGNHASHSSARANQRDSQRSEIPPSLVAAYVAMFSGLVEDPNAAAAPINTSAHGAYPLSDTWGRPLPSWPEPAADNGGMVPRRIAVQSQDSAERQAAHRYQVGHSYRYAAAPTMPQAYYGYSAPAQYHTAPQSTHYAATRVYHYANTTWPAGTTGPSYSFAPPTAYAPAVGGSYPLVQAAYPQPYPAAWYYPSYPPQCPCQYARQYPWQYAQHHMYGAATHPSSSHAQGNWAADVQSWSLRCERDRVPYWVS